MRRTTTAEVGGWSHSVADWGLASDYESTAAEL